MEWADGIGAARKRQGLAPQSLQRSVCNDSKSLVIRSKQAHVGRAAKFLENRHTQRFVELKMRYMLWPPAPSKPTSP
jgi:hypothetical protein